MGGRVGPKIHENFDFCVFWPRGPWECAQNDATGCGNTFHTRQTHFWELHFSTFFGPTFQYSTDNSLPCTNCPPMALGSNPPSQPVGGSTRLQLGHGGFLPSSPWTPELGPRPDLDPDPKILIPSAPRAIPLTHPISLFPHLGAGGRKIFKPWEAQDEIRSTVSVPQENG